MQPIRILQVMASLDRGGAETYLMNIYRAINKDKVQFDFVVNSNQQEYAYEQEIKDLGGRIYRMENYRIVNSISYRNSWKRLLTEHPEWKIIHGHHTSPAFIYLSVAKRLGRITIAHSHTAGGTLSIKSQIKRLLRYPLRHLADHLFACSKLAAKWMFGELHNRTTIINNAIDSSKFVFDEKKRMDKRQELGIGDCFVIGHVGRFSTQKNHEFAVRVFQEVHVEAKNSVLLLVGDGGTRKDIEMLVNKLNLTGKVIFTGVRSDIPELMMAMDVFLFPSLFEGLPLTLIEAQASGLKCIVADSVSSEAKITDQVQFLSLDESPKYWAKRILEHIGGYERPDCSKHISEMGYDVRGNSQLLEELYLELYCRSCGNGATSGF